MTWIFSDIMYKLEMRLFEFPSQKAIIKYPCWFCIGKVVVLPEEPEDDAEEVSCMNTILLLIAFIMGFVQGWF